MSPSCWMRWVNCVFTEAVDMDRAAQRATGVVLTPRLRLTPIGPPDVDDLIVLYSDPLVAFWTGPWNPATVRLGPRTWQPAGIWRVWASGWPGPAQIRRWSVGAASSASIFMASHAYATEIGRAALDWAAIHEPRSPLVAFTEVHNQASIRPLSAGARQPRFVRGQPTHGADRAVKDRSPGRYAG